MRSTEIIIALITLVGVLGSALFANWDRVFNEEKNEATLVVSPSSTKFGGISSTTNEKYVTNNTYDKNNTNYQSVIKSEINIIKQSRNTKKYNGIWEGIPVKVYIKWENYTGSHVGWAKSFSCPPSSLSFSCPPSSLKKWWATKRRCPPYMAPYNTIKYHWLGNYRQCNRDIAWKCRLVFYSLCMIKELSDTTACANSTRRE